MCARRCGSFDLILAINISENNEGIRSGEARTRELLYNLHQQPVPTAKFFRERRALVMVAEKHPPARRTRTRAIKQKQFFLLFDVATPQQTNTPAPCRELASAGPPLQKIFLVRP